LVHAGDRIALMSHGRLRACGSSLFLKKLFGCGYTLVLEKGQDCDSEVCCGA
jgi:ATP-binding cassette, subfamily A (ABC1), member 3